MGIKKSVFLSDQTEQIIRSMSRDGEHPQWSETINQTMTAANWVFRQSLPDLTSAEWQIILNAYSGTCGSLQMPPYRIASDLMDDLGLLDVNDHPAPDLVKRLHTMSQAEQFAILTFVQIFWSNKWDDVDNFDEVIRKISGKHRDSTKG